MLNSRAAPAALSVTSTPAALLDPPVPARDVRLTVPTAVR
jgi:hypothetical protein